MTKKAFAIAIAAACMASGAAFAQSYDYRNDRDGRGERYDVQQRSNHYDRRDYGYRNDGYRNDSYRRDDYRRNDYRDGRHRYDERYRHSTHRPYVQMRRGERMHHYYSGSQYVVRDWNRHRGLYAPHRGHHWVQVGNDYALVALATGIIAHVLLSN
jgi:hypothetical protein